MARYKCSPLFEKFSGNIGNFMFTSCKAGTFLRGQNKKRYDDPYRYFPSYPHNKLVLSDWRCLTPDEKETWNNNFLGKIDYKTGYEFKNGRDFFCYTDGYYYDYLDIKNLIEDNTFRFLTHDTITKSKVFTQPWNIEKPTEFHNYSNSISPYWFKSPTYRTNSLHTFGFMKDTGFNNYLYCVLRVRQVSQTWTGPVDYYFGSNNTNRYIFSLWYISEKVPDFTQPPTNYYNTFLNIFPFNINYAAISTLMDGYGLARSGLVYNAIPNGYYFVTVLFFDKDCQYVNKVVYHITISL